MWFASLVCSPAARLSSAQHLKDPTRRVGAPDVAAALTPEWSPTPDLYPALTALHM